MLSSGDQFVGRCKGQASSRETGASGEKPENALSQGRCTTRFGRPAIFHSFTDELEHVFAVTIGAVRGLSPCYAPSGVRWFTGFE